MSARVRRHLSVLAALLLLITMWSYRLESYDLMIRGGGEEGVFSYVDHQWLLPGLLLLWVATAAAAITVLLSGWTGQLRTSFVAVTVIVVLSISVQAIVPLLVRRITSKEAQMVREGADPVGGSPAQFGQFVQKEFEKWKVIVLESGARAE